MQLIKNILSLLFLVLTGALFAQVDATPTDTTAKKNGPIEIDILSSYYSQDGIHSPVTGGRGTESLSDLTSGTINRSGTAESHASL